MRLTEKQKENRRREDTMRKDIKEACKNADNDEQLNTVYDTVSNRLRGMRDIGIHCEIVVPGVTKGVKAIDIYDETDTEKLFQTEAYKHTQMLFVIEYHQQKHWYLAKIGCRDSWNNHIVWYLEAK